MVATVYLVWHQHDADDDNTGKLLGVFSSERLARSRIEQARSQPGFRRFLDAFVVDPYVVDQAAWPEGFATVDENGRWMDD
jgi:hypothetical protein